MKQSSRTDLSEKPSRTLLAAVLTILIFAAASFAAIMMIEAQKIPTLENDTAWLESYFASNTSSELSERQKDIIHNSAAITSAVAEDAGVTITLQSVCGNGYYTHYKVEVELPEDMNARQGDFEKIELKINDYSMGLGSKGSETQTLEDDNPNDNCYSLLITTKLAYYPDCDYAFDNGIIRTLHLENIQIENEGGQQSKLIEGQWEFGILFHNKGEVVELIQEPITVHGFSYWDNTYYEAEITSFVLAEFSTYCQYKPIPKSQGNIISLKPVVIMKDGRTVPMVGGSGGSGGDGYHSQHLLQAPVSLHEVAFVKLTDEVVLPMQ